MHSHVNWITFIFPVFGWEFTSFLNSYDNYSCSRCCYSVATPPLRPKRTACCLLLLLHAFAAMPSARGMSTEKRKRFKKKKRYFSAKWNTLDAMVFNGNNLILNYFIFVLSKEAVLWKWRCGSWRWNKSYINSRTLVVWLFNMQ